MPMGFVYVLFNPTITGMVKIGLSTDSSEARARALNTTGVADRFHVVYDELVSDCELVEYKMHTRFAELRHNSRREFFVMPIKTAVRALREEAAPYLVPDSALKNRCEILAKLNKKFPKYLARDLSSVAVIQLADLILLESRRRASRDRHDELVERVDLEFIADIEKTFPRDRDVRVNATAFVTNLDLATLLVIAESLFSEEGREMAISDFNKGLPPKLLA